MKKGQLTHCAASGTTQCDEVCTCFCHDGDEVCSRCEHTKVHDCWKPSEHELKLARERSARSNERIRLRKLNEEKIRGTKS